MNAQYSHLAYMASLSLKHQATPASSAQVCILFFPSCVVPRICRPQSFYLCCIQRLAIVAVIQQSKHRSTVLNYICDQVTCHKKKLTQFQDRVKISHSHRYLQEVLVAPVFLGGRVCLVFPGNNKEKQTFINAMASD